MRLHQEYPCRIGKSQLRGPTRLAESIVKILIYLSLIELGMFESHNYSAFPFS